MKKFCAYNPLADITFAGTKEEIVLQAYTFRLDKGQALKAKLNRGDYPEQTYHSYEEVWTTEEIRADIVQFLFKELKNYGYTLFEEL